MKPQLVLSLFPGIGLLDMAFELEGFCVVRGPDLLWGGNVKSFHPPIGKFDGVIGGPPCKGESNMAWLNGTPGKTLSDEFCRIIDEAEPSWWVMEAVKKHEHLAILNYWVLKLNNRWLNQEQRRVRFFHSNLDLAKHVETQCFEHPEFKTAVLAGHGPKTGTTVNGIAKYKIQESCRLQGLPETFTDEMPFTNQMKHEVIGNGVPIPMGRAIAKAVKESLQ